MAEGPAQHEPGAGPEREDRSRPPGRGGRVRYDAIRRVQSPSFPVALRGYDRRAVDAYVAEVSRLVSDLEANQLRESVIQRALEEVGEQTSGILERAHEAADALAARSRAQAEGRIGRAEREAEAIRAEAEAQAERVEIEVGRLWQERERLIEDLRGLADDLLGLAEDASARLEEPGRAGDGEDAGAEAGLAAERDVEAEAGAAPVAEDEAGAGPGVAPADAADDRGDRRGVEAGTDRARGLGATSRNGGDTPGGRAGADRPAPASGPPPAPGDAERGEDVRSRASSDRER